MPKWNMPIPAPPDGDRAHPLAATAALYRQLHTDVRAALDGLSGDQLQWMPCEGANSLATLVVHMLGSEAETLCSIAGLPAARDRDAEFVPANVDLLAMLDEADALLKRVIVTAPDMGRRLALPTLPPEERARL